MKRLTPKQKLIARLKAEGIIPESHTIHIEVMRWSTYRREMQWLPRVVILHYCPGVLLPEEIHADQTVTELANARRLTLWGVGTQETPELLGENSLTLEEENGEGGKRMNPESAYECATCADIFEDFEEAANCHNTSYHYVFFCGECWGNWNTKQEAEQCCQEEQNDH